MNRLSPDPKQHPENTLAEALVRFMNIHSPAEQGLHFDRDGRPIGMGDWVRLFEDRNYQQVAATEIPYKNKIVLVSTVWLGLDHGYRGGAPIIFETMTFNAEPGEESYCRRYATEEEALKGHEAIVAVVKASIEGQGVAGG